MTTASPSLTAIDLLVVAYLTWGLIKGFRRRLGRELEALIKLLLALAWLWGFGAFSWLRNTLQGLVESSPVSAGMLGSLLALLGTFYLLYLLRQRLADATEARLGETSARLWGALSGLLRTAAWSTALLLLLEKLPWLGDGIGESLSGFLVKRLAG